MTVLAEVVEKLLWIVTPALAAYLGVFGVRRAVNNTQRKGGRQ